VYRSRHEKAICSPPAQVLPPSDVTDDRHTNEETNEQTDEQADKKHVATA